MRAFVRPEWWKALSIAFFAGATLVPITCKVRERAQDGRCVANLSELGKALRLYVQDYDESWPPPAQWEPLFAARFPSARCPACGSSGGHGGYGYNGRAATFSGEDGGDAQIGAPSRFIVVAEQHPKLPPLILPTYFDPKSYPQGGALPFARHGGGAHYLFADGHAERLTPEQVSHSWTALEERPTFVP